MTEPDGPRNPGSESVFHMSWRIRRGLLAVFISAVVLAAFFESGRRIEIITLFCGVPAWVVQGLRRRRAPYTMVWWLFSLVLLFLLAGWLYLLWSVSSNQTAAGTLTGHNALR